jgi:hypothetical protein
MKIAHHCNWHRAKHAAEVQRTFWQRVFRRKPAVAA